MRKDAICTEKGLLWHLPRMYRGKKNNITRISLCVLGVCVCGKRIQLSEHSHPLQRPTSEQKWFLFIYFFTSFYYFILCLFFCLHSGHHFTNIIRMSFGCMYVRKNERVFHINTEVVQMRVHTNCRLKSFFLSVL